MDHNATVKDRGLCCLTPYECLGDAWANFLGRWLAQSGHRVGSGAMFELYRNSPMDTAPSGLVTDLYLSLA